MTPQLKAFFNLLVLDLMLGNEVLNEEIRKERLQHIEMGLYDNRVIFINEQKLKFERGFASLEDFYKYLHSLKDHTFDFGQLVELTIADFRRAFYSAFLTEFMNIFNFNKATVSLVEEEGIVFIDEIDKISSSKEEYGRKSPSTDGV